jgi:dual specificity phosphatase 12
MAQQLSFDAALSSLRASHPAATPNAGFVEQLHLWGAMGCRLDDNYPPYRRHRVARHAALRAAGSETAAPPLVCDPTEVQGAASVRCRKCRRLLATTEHAVAHERGAGVDARARGGVSNGVEVPCSSIFVEPMAWMADELKSGAVTGKLACPKCGCRLGGFSWAGEQCSCGAWVTPAFQLHASRVDAARAML